MQLYEYKVVPAPQRGDRVKGGRTTAERFANALMAVMNDLGRNGWEYLRADTLPCEERVGLTGRSSSFQHMLVFRRPLVDAPQKPAEMPAQPAAPSRMPVAAPALVAQSHGKVPRVMPFAKPVIVPPHPARGAGQGTATD